MAITRGQKVVDDNSTSGTTTDTVSVLAATTAGNHLILVLGNSGGTSGTVSSITDTKGNTWQIDVNTGTGGATGAWTCIASCHMASALTTSDTITVTWGLSPGFATVMAYEYSGLDTTTWLDKTAGATATSTSPASGNVTTLSANELLIGATCASSTTATHTPGSSFTEVLEEQTSSAHLDLVFDERIVAATGTYSHTGTLSASALWTDSIATYKAASGSSPQTVSVTGLGSAGAFGTPQENIAFTVGGLVSAGAFGTPTVSVGGTGQTVPVSGLASAGAFGSPTPSPGGVVVPVAGLGSAAAFSSPAIAQTIHVAGLGSAALFGVPTPSPGGVIVPITGLGSAGTFGSPAISGGAAPTFNPALMGKHPRR